MPSKEQTRDGKKTVSGQSLKKTPAENSEPLVQQAHPAAILQSARVMPGSLTPTAVLQLQQTIGNKATGRLLASGIQTSANNKIIQRTPDFHINQETHRYFKITYPNGEIHADETEMSAMESNPPPHYGYLIYQEHPKAKTMVLKTLLSDPEEGSGLGVLLMHMLARLALQKGYKFIEVTSPATDKLTYYAKFGFDIEERQAEIKEKYLSMGVAEEEMPNPIPVGSARTTPEKLGSETAASLIKRWKPVTLPPKESTVALKALT